jgi:addiction module HigA family antidote
MDQVAMAHPVSPDPTRNDDETFRYPDGISLPPSHPGETLADELAARGLTASALALKLRVPANRISDILRGRRAVSAETALRLGSLRPGGRRTRPGSHHRQGSRSGIATLYRHNLLGRFSRQADLAGRRKRKS